MVRGDHLYVRRSYTYTHHGIDCGDGTVIHYTGEPGSKRAAAIARSPLSEFACGGEVRVRRYGERNDPDTTIEAAESRLGETGYNLVFNNCEHFATWCCTGEGLSQQVRGLAGTAVGGATVASVPVATVTVVGAAGAVSGVSGAGIMSGLAAAGGMAGGGAVAGVAVLGAAPAVAVIGATRLVWPDDVTLPTDERAARRDGRVASVVGAAAGTVGAVGTLSAAGTAGVSAVGISTGLATVGGSVGLGMLGGAVILVAAPAAAAAAAGVGAVYGARYFYRRRRQSGPEATETSELQV